MKRFIRDAVFDAVCDLAAQDERIVLLTADADAYGLQRFKKNFPDRFLNVGIAEQAMVTMAAGLALAGKKVFIYAIAPFVTLRCLEQIKVNLCMMRLPVYILGLGIGSAYGFDGPTHHSLFDVGIMMSLPLLSVYNPCDYASAAFCVEQAAKNRTPAYIRIDKDPFEDIYETRNVPEAGFAVVQNKAADKLVIATGICTHYALEAAVDCDIVDLYDLTGFRKEELVKIIGKHKEILVYEEQWERAGISHAVYELVLSYQLNVRVKKLGISEEHCMSHMFGTREWLHDQYGILPENLKDRMERQES